MEEKWESGGRDRDEEGGLRKVDTGGAREECEERDE